MEFVIFSNYFALREIAFTLCRVNKEFESLCVSYIKYFKNKSRKGRDLTFMSVHRYGECHGCHNSPRRCSVDPFGSLQGCRCYKCQPRLMCLTRAKTYLDSSVLNRLDRVYKNGCTFFLLEDIRAYNTLFEGPRDRKRKREEKKRYIQQERERVVGSLFDPAGILDTKDRDGYMCCKYIKMFVRCGEVGKRNIQNLINLCHKRSKEVYTELQQAQIPDMPLVLTLGACLGWGVNKMGCKYSIDLQRIEIAKENFLDFKTKYELRKREKSERQEMLCDAFIRHGISTSRIDTYSYVSYGTPSIEDTCRRMHEVKWLHECTPFCQFVEQNKRTRIIQRDFIRPEPYYNMIFGECIEAKAMVLSLGYTCPPFLFI